jgi:hypothetical protein
MQLAPVGTPLWKTTYNNIAPRFGLSYLLENGAGREMVIRGGFGVFFDTGNNQASAGLFGYPLQASRTITNLAYPLTPAQAAPPTLPNFTNPATPYGTMFIFDPSLKLPYTLDWNVTIEKSLGKDQALTIAYVGAAGRRLLQQRQLTLSSSTVHINPSFTTVRLTTNRATSDYNSLQAQFQRRLAKGLQVLTSYTWSHALDDDSVDNQTIIPVRGNSAYDVRHNFASALTYDIPAVSNEPIVGSLIRGWSIDASVRARSAFPVDILGTQFINPADGTLVAARANRREGIPLYVNDNLAPGGRRINRDAFSIPGTGTFGNLGRNIVRGLGAWQVDMAVRRQISLSEKVRLQLRVEAFNVFNHPNFGSISTVLTATNFGQATAMLNRQLTGLNSLYQIGGPRSMQVALKIIF